MILVSVFLRVRRNRQINCDLYQFPFQFCRTDVIGTPGFVAFPSQQRFVQKKEVLQCFLRHSKGLVFLGYVKYSY